jgi:glucan phosphoethanolaminetransferase (alkaline phosphatase superfamily)
MFGFLLAARRFLQSSLISSNSVYWMIVSGILIYYLIVCDPVRLELLEFITLNGLFMLKSVVL